MRIDACFPVLTATFINHWFFLQTLAPFLIYEMPITLVFINNFPFWWESNAHFTWNRNIVYYESENFALHLYLHFLSTRSKHENIFVLFCVCMYHKNQQILNIKTSEIVQCLQRAQISIFRVFCMTYFIDIALSTNLDVMRQTKQSTFIKIEMWNIFFLF